MQIYFVLTIHKWSGLTCWLKLQNRERWCHPSIVRKISTKLQNDVSQIYKNIFKMCKYFILISIWFVNLVSQQICITASKHGNKYSYKNHDHPHCPRRQLSFARACGPRWPGRRHYCSPPPAPPPSSTGCSRGPPSTLSRFSALASHRSACYSTSQVADMTDDVGDLFRW